MTIEPREIEAFLTVADELHFGRAAARLHLSPTRISQTVRALERRIAAPLFERSSRRVRLTPLGSQLLVELRPAFQRLREVLANAQRSAVEQPQVMLRVAFANSLLEDIISPLVAACATELPDVAIVRYAYPGMQQRQWCDQQHDDVYVSWFPAEPRAPGLPRAEFGPTIAHDPRSLLVGRDHPLAHRDRVDIEELADHDLLHPPTITEQFADAWTPPATPAGRPLRRIPALTSTYIEEAFQVVLGRGLAHITITHFSASSIPNPDLTLIPLTGLPPFRLASMWSATADSHTIRSFAQLAARTGARQGWLGR
ncbi:LysR family transcriptional regulator [Pseudonocardia bannensis]|uniref:LysR family transcriptional regulator n=1 Tax=Pseudonocardia bannensis TaxID=630973 RepID=A0A848DL31_9PSEU|nr:LysR family transcriptional regulator [Pseudonocardia bannensis]